MKTLLIIWSMLLPVTELQAQVDSIRLFREEAQKKMDLSDADTLMRKWRRGISGNLTINQTSLNNWAAGGDKFSMALGGNCQIFAIYKKDKVQWLNIADLAYGIVNSTSLGSRKSDDRIDLSSKYGHRINLRWYGSLLVNLRTQFAKGYQYPKDSAAIFTSSFFSPAYLLISPGIDYKYDSALSVLFSPCTGRFIMVMDKYLSGLGNYGLDTGKHVRYELGAYIAINYYKKIVKNISYRGRIDFFSDYRNHPENIDIFFTNLLECNINKLIAVILTFDLIYDDNVHVVTDEKTGTTGARMQIKQVIGVGVCVKFNEHWH
ncbi:MAG TPA: DUF3078 domain-containing protein [Chitinophaga sp.]|uniref:DUF3078 domain-containing protein n=1 Tax=Chitinophaga sp. TaxID=1869181 RepID=UPI002C8A5FF9|nr:DUF3078 domain-containing protein [Chitinophaga sp.]HVI46147.1 DUF3078 domain-containing protein [Chitinophaga sp.]